MVNIYGINLYEMNWNPFKIGLERLNNHFLQLQATYGNVMYISECDMCVCSLAYVCTRVSLFEGCTVFSDMFAKMNQTVGINVFLE